MIPGETVTPKYIARVTSCSRVKEPGDHLLRGPVYFVTGVNCLQLPSCSSRNPKGEKEMSAPLTTVGSRFQAMKVKDNRVKLGVPASEAHINEQFQQGLLIDPALTQDNLTARDPDKATSLKGFMKTHCHASHYMFQVKKCTCYYCLQYPVRHSHDMFTQLSFLPLPLRGMSNGAMFSPYLNYIVPSYIGSPGIIHG